MKIKIEMNWWNGQAKLLFYIRELGGDSILSWLMDDKKERETRKKKETETKY